MPFVSRKDTTASTSSSASAILNLRGGDLGPISADALAKTFGVFAIGDALSGAIKPSEVWEKLGVTIEKGSKGEHYLGHGLASSAASLAVTSLLALFGKTSTEEAIAFGFLTRAIFMSEMLLTGKYKDLGVPQVPHMLIYLILLGTAFSLLSGQGDYMAAAKLISVVLCGHGALLFLNPRIDDDDETKAMAKIDGGYMFVSSLYTALLSFGMDAVQAMGFVAIACLPLFLAVLDISTAETIFGMAPEGWGVLIAVFVVASAYGMLN
jgi:hypothetical protein